MAGLLDFLNNLGTGLMDASAFDGSPAGNMLLQRRQAQALQSQDPMEQVRGLIQAGVPVDKAASFMPKAADTPEFLQIAQSLGMSPEQTRSLWMQKNTPTPAAVVNLSNTQEGAFRKGVGEQVAARVAKVDEGANLAFDALDGINRAVTAVQGGAYTDPVAAQKALITEVAPILGANVDPEQVAAAANTRELQRFSSMIQLQAQQYMKGNANGKEAQTIKEATNAFGQGEDSLANSLAVASLGAKKAQYIQQRVYEAIESGADATTVARTEALARRDTIITPDALRAEREKYKSSFKPRQPVQPTTTGQQPEGRLWRRVQ